MLSEGSDRALMRNRNLGGTRLRVTELGFGGGPIGNLYSPVTDETAAACVAAAWDVGVRYFDTAPHYGLGLSEIRLGRALASRPRDQFLVSTKVGRLLVPNPRPTEFDQQNRHVVPGDLIRHQDYSRDGVLRSLEASLRRLNLDRVDIVFVHDPEEHMQQALDEALPTLIDLREQGVIGAVGVAMNYVEPLGRFVSEADIDVVLEAGRWTLMDRSARQLLDECAARRIGVVAAAPFNSGLLATSAPSALDHFNYRHPSSEVLETARTLARVCQTHACALPHAAVRFPLQHASVVSVLTGLRDAKEVRSAAAWIARPLPDNTWKALDQVVVRGT